MSFRNTTLVIVHLANCSPSQVHAFRPYMGAVNELSLTYISHKRVLTSCRTSSASTISRRKTSSLQSIWISSLPRKETPINYWTSSRSQGLPPQNMSLSLFVAIPFTSIATISHSILAAGDDPAEHAKHVLQMLLIAHAAISTQCQAARYGSLQARTISLHTHYTNLPASYKLSFWTARAVSVQRFAHWLNPPVLTFSHQI